MQNLIVNGCSFTEEFDDMPSWATFLNEQLQPYYYKNIAQSAAGNRYICDSTITFLEASEIPSEDTLVIIMWSGIDRKDIHISREWFNYIKDQYSYCHEENDGSYYLNAGGEVNSWLENKETKKIFEGLYKTSDYKSMCIESLLCFIQLESYLKENNYNFLFTSFFNIWEKPRNPSKKQKLFIKDYCSEMPIYENFNLNNWWFIDSEKNCLGDFASNLNYLDSDGFHPSEVGHSKFADMIYSHILDKNFHV
jgi:hypothetical protein